MAYPRQSMPQRSQAFRRWRGWAFFILCWLFSALPSAGAQSSPTLSLNASAGYETYFREGDWLPVTVRIRNQGEALRGTLTIRPETSGRVVAHAYSAPLDLPAGVDRLVTLYIQARRFPPRLIIEVLDDAQTRLAQTEVPLTLVPPEQKLYVVVTGDDDQTLALSQVHSAAGGAVQAQIRASAFPTRAELLRAVDVLFIASTAGWSAEQSQALSDYVLNGGYAVLLGGTDAQSLSRSLGTLSPVQVTGVETRTNLQALADWAGVPAPSARAISLAQAELLETGRALIQDDTQVWVARRAWGAGWVDWLAFDPRLAPFNQWDGMAAFWRASFASAPIAPSLASPLSDFAAATQAVAILPDIELLPPLASLVLFLLAYIVLLIPLNYLLLSRLKRREWAWLSIPTLIIGFTALAWTLGFNLRGEELVLSRQALVRVYADGTHAQAQSMVGVLSPRRTSLDLLPSEQTWLTVQAGLSQNPSTFQSSAEVRQAERFSLQALALDGGIFSNVLLSAQVAKPAISGDLLVVPEARNAFGMVTQPARLQGILRNQSTWNLQDAVLLAGATSYVLPAGLAAGESLSLSGDEIVWQAYPQAFASRLEAPDNPLDALGLGNLARSVRLTTVNDNSDLTRNQLMSAYRLGLSVDSLSDAQRTRLERILARRQTWLTAFLRDQYSQNALGDHAYLLAWVDALPPELGFETGRWRTQDSTLVIVQIPLRFEQAPQDLQASDFIWTALERNGTVGGADSVVIDAQQSISLRFVPLKPLSASVSELRVGLTRSGGYGRSVQVSLRDWQTGEWVPFGDATPDEYSLSEAEAQRFIGIGGAVDVRLEMLNLAGTARIRDIHISMKVG